MNGFSDSAYFILNGFSDSVSGFSYSTDSRILNGFSVRILSSRILGFSEAFADSQKYLRILNGFSVADSQKLLKLDFSSIYVIIYLKTQITLVLEGFRTNPEKYELFEFDFFRSIFFLEIQKVPIIFFKKKFFWSKKNQIQKIHIFEGLS